MTTWYADLEAGSDNNSGDSFAVTQSGSDGVGNGTTTFTSASANFTGLTGRYIFIVGRGNYKIVTVNTANSVVLSGGVTTGSALAWTIGGAVLTWSTGLTGPRGVAAGDTVRCKASKAPSLIGGGSATWTQNSATVTLTAAVTQLLDDLEAAWTAATNVTTSTTTNRKSGATSGGFTTGGAFTTGLMAYKTLGSALNLSGYNQVTFWLYVQAGVSLAAGTLSLRLCSDTAGAVTVNTVPLPALPTSGQWVPVTVDTGAALGASIQSIALYADSTFTSKSVYLDNINAALPSSSAGALTLNTLIGREANISWAPTTAYSLNQRRRPTQPNRNAWHYQCTTAGTSGSTEPTWPTTPGATVTDGTAVWTCSDLEDTWYALQSINGTTLTIDGVYTTQPGGARGYDQVTETAPTYVRQPFMPSYGSSPNWSWGVAGSDAAHITVSGGWDRTAMSTQSDETWIDLAFATNSQSIACAGYDFVDFYNFGSVRTSTSAGMYFSGRIGLFNCHVGHSYYGITLGSYVTVKGMSVKSSLQGSMNNSTPNSMDFYGVSFSSHLTDGINLSGGQFLRANHVRARNNSGRGVNLSSSAGKAEFHNLITGGNASGGVYNQGYGDIMLVNSSVPETTKFAVGSASYPGRIFSHRDGQVANAHVIYAGYGTVQSDTATRHTGSGISWKFLPNGSSSGRNPLKLSVARIACTANNPVTVNVYTYRDATSVSGQLVLRGGQAPGVMDDVVVNCAPAINTWTNSGTLSFTPTENCVVEIEFWAWDASGAGHFWIDDASVTQ